MIALSIIVLLGLTGGGFLLYKWLHRAPYPVRAYNEACILMRNGQYEDACARAQEALGYGGEDILARQLIVRARVMLKQFDEADKIIQDGLTDQRREQYDAGLEILRTELAKLGPTEDRPAKVKEVEKKLMTTHPGYGEYSQLVLLGLRVQLSQVQGLIASHPAELTLTAEAQNQSGIYQTIEEKLYKVSQTLRTLLRERPEDESVYQMSGELFQVRGELVLASASAYVKEVQRFRLMDHNVEAASAQRRAREILAELPILRGNALWAFQNACRCNPDSIESRIALANLLQSGANPDYNQALGELQEILKRADRVSGDYILLARVIRADIIRRLGQLNEAIDDMAALYQSKPKSNMAALMYIDLLLERAESSDDPALRQTSVQEASRVIQEVEKQTQNPQLVFEKSRILLAQGASSEAIANLSQVVDNLASQNQGPQFVARVYYYLGKAWLFDVDQARLAFEKADQALRDAQQSGVKENIEKAVVERQSAEEKYRSLAEGAKRGLDALNQSIALIRMVRQNLPPDARLDAQLVDAQTTVVQTMMARGELGDLPERMLQTLAADLDNALVYDLLAKAITREKDPDKSRRLTVAAVNFRLLSGKYDVALAEAEKAISIFGVTPIEATQALKEAQASQEQITRVKERIMACEQLQAAAGLAALLQGMTTPGMEHFARASELHDLVPGVLPLSPDIYAQQQYALLTMIQLRRGMSAEADQTLVRALKQFPDSERLFVTKAGMARERGRLGTAIEAYKHAIELAPKRGELYTVLADLYLDMGMKDEAAKEIALVPPDVERTFYLLVQFGQVYFRLGDHDQLRKVAGELLRKFGNDPRAGLRVRLIAASFYANCGDYAEAARLASDIPENVQVPPDLNVQRAIIFIGTGQYEQAAEVLEQVMKVRPDDPSFFTLGLVYLQMDQRPSGAGEARRKVVQALQLAQQISKNYPEFAHARLLEAVALFQTDKTASALETLQTPFSGSRGSATNEQLRQQMVALFLVSQGQLDAALKQVKAAGIISNTLTSQIDAANANMLTRISQLPADQRKRALETLARSYLAKRGQLWRLAVANDEELARLLPDDPSVATALAWDYGNIDQLAKACAVLNDSLKAHPVFAEGWRVLGLLCSRAGDLTGAETAFRKFLSLIDDAPSVAVDLAQVLERAGKTDQVVPLYESIVSKTDRFPDALNNLAYHLAAGPNPDLERGLAYAKRAIEFSPYNANYYDTLGWIYCLQGSTDQAVENLGKSIVLSPTSPTTYYHLAMAYLKQTSMTDDQRKKKAADALREALAITPTFPEADLARAELQKLSGY